MQLLAQGIGQFVQRPLPELPRPGVHDPDIPVGVIRPESAEFLVHSIPPAADQQPFICMGRGSKGMQARKTGDRHGVEPEVKRALAPQE